MTWDVLIGSLLVAVVNIFWMRSNNKRSMELFRREQQVMNSEYALVLCERMRITPEQFADRMAEAAPHMERVLIQGGLRATVKH